MQPLVSMPKTANDKRVRLKHFGGRHLPATFFYSFVAEKKSFTKHIFKVFKETPCYSVKYALCTSVLYLLHGEALRKHRVPQRKDQY